MNIIRQPLVSFIITYYNLPTDMLAECVDSILSLPLSNNEREIILVDDGSDKSPVDGLGARRENIIYIRQNNRGLSEARNRGLQSATGSYIQFVDGDDMLIANGYGKCLGIIRQACPDMVMFKMSGKGEPSTKVFQMPKPTSGVRFMLNNNIRASACGYIFKRTILGDLRFIGGILHEDEAFTPQLVLQAESLYPTAAVAYFYRERPHSITHDTTNGSVTRRLDDIERIIKHLNATAACLNGEPRRAMERRIAQLTMDYIYDTIKLAKSASLLDERISRLRAGGLFPLPRRRYTFKYVLFRYATKYKAARALLGLVLR